MQFSELANIIELANIGGQNAVLKVYTDADTAIDVTEVIYTNQVLNNEVTNIIKLNTY